MRGWARITCKEFILAVDNKLRVHLKEKEPGQYGIDEHLSSASLLATLDPSEFHEVSP
jgi:hypothetical protein